MERKEPPWYRLLWKQHLLFAALATVTWGWLLLAACFAIPYGIAKLIGADTAEGSTGLSLVLAAGAALSLLAGYCLGYLTGHDERSQQTHRDDFRVRNEFQEEYRRDVADLQEQAQRQRRGELAEAAVMARQLERATFRCRICPGFSDFIYEDDGDVYGLCKECDALIQSSQRIKLVPRRAERLAELTGTNEVGPELMAAAATELTTVARGKIDRRPHDSWASRMEQFDTDETLVPRSWEL